MIFPTGNLLVCHNCQVTEDEVHFTTSCSLYDDIRKPFFDLIGLNDNFINQFDPLDVFSSVMNLTDRYHLIALAEFAHKSFAKRKLFIDDMLPNNNSI